MARAQRLKLFRTAIGFHDAYVAAPSRKAALEAWGAKADLFARGVAEQVDDPELAREAMAKPGTVIRRSRGTTAEQLAALPPDAPAKTRTKDRLTKSVAGTKPKPRPSRAALDAAQAASDEADRRHEAALAELSAREAALRKERREAEDAYDAARARLDSDRERARDRYERAMARWRR